LFKGCAGSSFVSVSMTSGSVTRGTTCTGGYFTVAGTSGTFTNNGTGGTIQNNLFNDDSIDTALSATHGSGAWTGDAASISEILTKIRDVHTIETGRWKIDTNTNQLVFYADDDITPVFSFNLYDEDELPTSTDVMERRPA